MLYEVLKCLQQNPLPRIHSPFKALTISTLVALIAGTKLAPTPTDKAAMLESKALRRENW